MFTFRSSLADQRFSGSFCRHFVKKSLNSGDQLFGFLSVGGSDLAILSRTLFELNSFRGGSVSASSMHVMPNDHMSVLLSYQTSLSISQAIISGLIQYGVPMNVFLSSALFRDFEETPKSHNLTNLLTFLNKI